MRLISATLRDCRLHRELRVQFDPKRTCITGPNESGKSTLLEAIHRALFLKAKGNTEHHRALVPRRGGTPEVTLEFEAGGERFQLTKRFGSNGTVALETRHGTLHGEAAEDRLAQITRAAKIQSRDGVCRQWSHLWSWQGESHLDPTEHATKVCNTLLQRLQTFGAAGALLSPRDAALAERIAHQYHATYRENGQPRVESELYRALARARDALERAEQARYRIQRLAGAARDLDEAEKTLQEIDTSQRHLEAQLAEARSLHEEVVRLRKQRDAQQRDADSTAAAVHHAEQIEQAAAQLARELADARTRLAPINERSERLETALTSARLAFDDAREAETQAAAREREARTVADFHRLHASIRERRRAVSEGEDAVRRLADLRAELRALEEELAALPKVTPESLETLRQLETNLARAQAARDAAAVRIEVLSVEHTVRLDGIPQEPGTSLLLHKPAEIAIGGSRLRIIPGGTVAGAAARAVDAAEASLRDTLNALGTFSVAEAAAILQRRTSLEQDIRPKRRSLDEIETEGVESRLQRARDDLRSEEAQLARIRDSLARSLPEPSDVPEAARTTQRAAEEDLRQAADACALARAKAEAAQHALREAEQTRERHQAEQTTAYHSVLEVETRLRALEEREGGAARRLERLHECRAAAAAARAALEATEARLLQIGPERVASDIRRLERAIEGVKERREQAIRKRAAAEALLRNDGTADPYAEAELAEADAARARNFADAERRRAEALARLHRAFEEERARLNEAFTTPLARAVEPYVACIFGPRATIRVSLDEGRFGALQLVRDGTALPFECLSGGTREQLAGAFRLAIAELLAAEHGGCLPVVFDDAFAWSDPERSRAVPAMLDRAAEAGLQILLVSCSPRDLEGLGGHWITLERNPEPATTTAPLSLGADRYVNGGEEGDQVEPAVTPSQENSAAESSAEAEHAFLTALQRRGGRCSNAALIQDLGWNAEQYESMKRELVATGRIQLGKGRGGTVELIPTSADLRALLSSPARAHTAPQAF